jgi:curved DNA-binding protein CbpA
MLKKAYDILGNAEKRGVYDNEGIEGLTFMGEEEFAVFKPGGHAIEN